MLFYCIFWYTYIKCMSDRWIRSWDRSNRTLYPYGPCLHSWWEDIRHWEVRSCQSDQKWNPLEYPSHHPHRCEYLWGSWTHRDSNRSQLLEQRVSLPLLYVWELPWSQYRMTQDGADHTSHCNLRYRTRIIEDRTPLNRMRDSRCSIVWGLLRHRWLYTIWWCESLGMRTPVRQWWISLCIALRWCEFWLCGSSVSAGTESL